MTDTPGGRDTKLGDPTAEGASDPVPAGEDVIGRENPRPGETPRRYDESATESEITMPEDDATLNTRI